MSSAKRNRRTIIILIVVLVLGCAAIAMIALTTSGVESKGGNPDDIGIETSIENDEKRQRLPIEYHREEAPTKTPVESDAGQSEKRIEALGLDASRLQAGRQRIRTISKWLLPVERAVLVHTEMEEAGANTGHAVDELNLPVDTGKILQLVSSIEGLLEQGENENLAEATTSLRERIYGPDATQALKNWDPEAPARSAAPDPGAGASPPPPARTPPLSAPAPPRSRSPAAQGHAPACR